MSTSIKSIYERKEIEEHPRKVGNIFFPSLFYKVEFTVEVTLEFN